MSDFGVTLSRTTLPKTALIRAGIGQAPSKNGSAEMKKHIDKMAVQGPADPHGGRIPSRSKVFDYLARYVLRIADGVLAPVEILSV